MKLPYQNALPKAGFDAVIALTALALALGIRFWADLFSAVETPQALKGYYQDMYLLHAPILVAAVLAVFGVIGIYTRKRFYARRFRALAVAQGVTLAFGILVAVVYLIGKGDNLAPRVAYLLAYGFTLAGTLGTRLGKHYIESHYTVEPTGRPASRSIRKVLLVGGAGYIGSQVARDLLAKGYQVRMLDAVLFGDTAIRELYRNPNFELRIGDFRHVGPVVNAVKGMDAVIHLGAIVGDPACAVDEDETIATNLAATRLLADICKAFGVSRLLFASTCSVYGAAEEVVDEQSILNPVSLYAATKIDSEKVLLAARTREFHPTVLRLATAFGWSHRPRFDLVVNLLTAKAHFEKKIVIYNGEQWRPFIHVKDISKAFLMAIDAPLEIVSGQTFNVGDDRLNHTLTELAGIVADLNPGLEVENVNNSDARTYHVSFDKIRTQIGFRCDVSLKEGIEEIQYHLIRGEVKDYADSRYSNLKLVTQKRDEEQEAARRAPASAPKLTALKFAQRSVWSRALAAGAKADELLQAEMIGLMESDVPVTPGGNPDFLPMADLTRTRINGDA